MRIICCEGFIRGNHYFDTGLKKKKKKKKKKKEERGERLQEDSKSGIEKRGKLLVFWFFENIIFEI